MGTSEKSNNKGNDKPADKLIDPATQLHEIQKLLFGQQIAQLEQLMAAMRSDLTDQLAALNKTFSNKLAQQKDEFKLQLSELAQHVEAQNSEHQNRESLIEQELDSLGKRLDAFEAQTETAHDALEKQFSQETRLLKEEMESAHHALSEQVKRQGSDLGDTKVDRSTLADLLGQLAANLKA